MVLPVGFERTNEKLYEEVNIPATDRPPEDFQYTPVYINKLDEVTQDFMCAYFKSYFDNYDPVTVVEWFIVWLINFNHRCCLISVLKVGNWRCQNTSVGWNSGGAEKL